MQEQDRRSFGCGRGLQTHRYFKNTEIKEISPQQSCPCSREGVRAGYGDILPTGIDGKGTFEEAAGFPSLGIFKAVRMGPEASWDSGKCPCLWQGVGWKEMMFKLHSNPKHSMTAIPRHKLTPEHSKRSWVIPYTQDMLVPKSPPIPPARPRGFPVVSRG